MFYVSSSLPASDPVTHSPHARLLLVWILAAIKAHSQKSLCFPHDPFSLFTALKFMADGLLLLKLLSKADCVHGSEDKTLHMVS